MMNEIPELRWSFILKVYYIIAAKVFATIFIGCFGVILRDAYIRDRNHYTEELFTGSISVLTGFACASTSNKVILEAMEWTAVVVVVLTLYVFWASMGGQDFSLLSPILFGCRVVLVLEVIISVMIQFFFPLGNWFAMIYGGFDVIMLCGFIVYNTDNLIKWFPEGELVCRSTYLYLDIINLFLALRWVFDVFDAD